MVIGIDYQDANYDANHPTKSWTAASGCTATLSWTLDYVGDAWNDRISSAQGFSGCNRYEHYENSGRSGSLYVCNCATMGVMNDQTSSEWFKHS